MTEKQKTGLLWVLCGVTFIVMFASILFLTPSPFAAVIEPSKTVDSSAPTAIEDGSFNINTATREEWFSLEGMNTTIYLRIVRRLEEHTVFQTVDDLLEIDGITPELLDLWRDRLWCA